MTFELPDRQVDQTESFHPAGLALLLETLGALPQSSINLLIDLGHTVKVAPGRASAGQQRLGSNVIKLM
jgi:hypothetical protein